MSQQLLFIVLGLGLGAVYAALSHGHRGHLPGHRRHQLRRRGDGDGAAVRLQRPAAGELTLPLPVAAVVRRRHTADMAVRRHRPGRRGGARRAVQLLVSRPLRNAPVLAKVVAAVGIMLTLQAGVALKYGTEPGRCSRMLPTGTVEVGRRRVADRPAVAHRRHRSCSAAALAVWFRAVAHRPRHPGRRRERAGGVVRPPVAADASGMVTWVLATVFDRVHPDPRRARRRRAHPAEPHAARRAGARRRAHRPPPVAVGRRSLGALGPRRRCSPSCSSSRRTKSWWPEWAKQGLLDAVPFLVIVVTLFVARPLDPDPRRRDALRAAAGDPAPQPTAGRSPLLTVAGVLAARAHVGQLPLRRHHQPRRSPSSPCRSWCSPAWSARSRWPRRRSPASPASPLSKSATASRSRSRCCSPR